MRHTKFCRLIDDYIHNRLAEDLLESFETHMLSCLPCRKKLEESQRIWDLVEESGEKMIQRIFAADEGTEEFGSEPLSPARKKGESKKSLFERFFFFPPVPLYIKASMILILGLGILISYNFYPRVGKKVPIPTGYEILSKLESKEKGYDKACSAPQESLPGAASVHSQNPGSTSFSDSVRPRGTRSQSEVTARMKYPDSDIAWNIDDAQPQDRPAAEGGADRALIAKAQTDKTPGEAEMGETPIPEGEEMGTYPLTCQDSIPGDTNMPASAYRTILAKHYPKDVDTIKSKPLPEKMCPVVSNMAAETGQKDMLERGKKELKGALHPPDSIAERGIDIDLEIDNALYPGAPRKESMRQDCGGGIPLQKGRGSASIKKAEIEHFAEERPLFQKGSRGDETLKKPAIADNERFKGKPETGSDLWGLIIGIGHYPNMHRAGYEKTRAISVKGHFMEYLGIQEGNIIIMLDKEATMERIRGYIKEYLPKNIRVDTRLYIYFTGHFALYKNDGALMPDFFIVPYDGDVASIEKTCYSLNVFYQDLGALDIEKVYVFFDTSLHTAEWGKMLEPEHFLPLDEVHKNLSQVVAFYSFNLYTPDVAYSEGQGGAFTQYLLQGLSGGADKSGDSLLSAGELYTYMRSNTERVSKVSGIEQTLIIYPRLEVIKDVIIMKTLKDSPPT